MMRKSCASICLTVVLALMMMIVLGPSSRAEAQVEVKIKVDRNLPNGPVEISLDDKNKRFVGLCKSGNNGGQKKHCDGSQFKWTLQGNTLKEDETLVIKNAPYHLACFAGTVPITFTPSAQKVSKTSGEPNAACSQDKYGTYWPYVVELYKTGTQDPIATTDPGGIIHP